MKYSEYDIQDFLKDEDFVKWVLHPDGKANAHWTTLLEENPSLQKKAKTAREIIANFRYKEKFEMTDQESDQVIEKLKRHQLGKRYERRRKQPWALGIAASLAILLCMAWLKTEYYTRQPQQKEKTTWLVKNTKKGEKLTVQLPDGSLVKLNANSTLIYPNNFDSLERKVQLEGEAFFEVAKDSLHPFRIESDKIQTTVLGTSFNIRAYTEETSIQVAVVTGKVKVESDQHEQVELVPNDVSLYEKTEAHLTASQQNIDDLIAWRQNVLIFKNDAAPQVWEKLENWYGVNIIQQRKKPIEGRFSGKFENASLEKVLEAVGFSSEFKFEIIDDETIIIK